MSRNLYIDPGSKSTGWASFVDGDYVDSGTIAVEGAGIWARLLKLWARYYDLTRNLKPTWIYVERMNSRVHRFCQWAAVIITFACKQAGAEVGEEVSPSSWKKYLKERDSSLATIQSEYDTDSEDEAVAITIGLYKETH